MRAAPDQQQQRNKSKGAYRSVAPPRAFACEERGASFSVAVLGDLHLPPGDAVPEDFLKARDQLTRDMVASAPGAAHRVVQLGDLGAYDKGFPGSAACFKMAKSYIDSFEIPSRLILGNHDLEDAALDSDAENLVAWREAFGQSHYWSSKIGNVTFVGLSTVRFRSNEHSVHEVHIDDEQIAFFERVLGDAGRDGSPPGGSPVVVFTHAPILGSGLKAVQAVHVKNRCAWVNHSSNADHFISLVRRNPNVKLWFSGHFHLSQSYPDSISVVGGTAFVLTGVIGGSMSRDGDRHSRVLRGDESGFEVLTMDHETGESRVDLKGSWDARDTPRILTPPEELICDISSGFLCSEVDCSVGGSIDEDDQRPVWFNSGATSMLHLQDGLLIEVRDDSLVHALVLALLLLLLLSHILVAHARTHTRTRARERLQYDAINMAPIGAVFLDVPDECFVRLVDQRGDEVDATSTDGSAAVAVEMVDARSGEVRQSVPRNEQGGFYCIFQPNKYVLNSPGLGSLLSLALRPPSFACSSGGRRCRLSLPRPRLRR